MDAGAYDTDLAFLVMIFVLLALSTIWTEFMGGANHGKPQPVHHDFWPDSSRRGLALTGHQNARSQRGDSGRCSERGPIADRVGRQRPSPSAPFRTPNSATV